MAITLLADIGATDTAVRVTDPGFASRRFPFVADLDGELVEVRGGGFDSRANDGTYHLMLDRGVEGSAAASHSAGDELDPTVGATTGSTGAIELAPTFNDVHSFQSVAADVNLGAAAGAAASNPKFLAGVMGNAIGADLTKAGAYVAGVIAALAVTGTKASHYQVGALLGIVMDGVTAADGAVVAVIDGSDPSAATRANAAFAARMNNNHASSGVDYGLDLYDAGRGADMTAGLALAIAKAILRTPSEVCILEGDAAPVDGTTGAGFAAGGSLYVRTHAGAIAHYINTGSKATPAWKAVTHA